MDQEHYVDWMITSLHSSDLNSVPIWLLITRMHWKEILQYRRRGQRLAEALLEQFRRVCAFAAILVDDPLTMTTEACAYDGDDIFHPIQEELARLLKSFMIAKPACFIIPSSWLKYESLLRSCISDEETNLTSTFEQLSSRNLHLIRSRDKHTRHAVEDARPEILTLLDNISNPFNLKITSEACLQVNGNRELLIITMLEWASSLYRRGRLRVYIAVRLLRRWARLGVDISGPVLAFLAASSAMVGLQKDNVYRVIAELVRSKHFSVGKYLQWLLARGSLSGRNSFRPVSSDLLLTRVEVSI